MGRTFFFVNQQIKNGLMRGEDCNLNEIVGQETDVCEGKLWKYRPFHKTLPRSREFLNWISVRFYEMGCRWKGEKRR